jgi:hypothetical protein
LRLYRRGQLVDYLLAGAITGIAMSLKYTGVVGVVMLPAAHLLRTGWKGIKDPKLYAALALVPVAFLVGTPFAILDHRKFLEDLFYEIDHYSSGHHGMEDDTPLWYLTYMLRHEGVVMIVAAVEGIRSVLNRNKPALIVASFPAVYLVFVSTFSVRNDRTLLPALAFLLILSAGLLVHVWHRTSSRPPGLRRTVSRAAVLLFAAILVAVPLFRTVESGLRYGRSDSRETARVWIDSHLPENAQIVVEAYSLLPDQERFEVRSSGRIIDHSPDWYVSEGTDYVVFGEYMFGRYYADPLKYADEVALYDEMFSTFELVRIFTDNDYEIRVYRVRP